MEKGEEGGVWRWTVKGLCYRIATMLLVIISITNEGIALCKRNAEKINLKASGHWIGPRARDYPIGTEQLKSVLLMSVSLR